LRRRARLRQALDIGAGQIGAEAAGEVIEERLPCLDGAELLGALEGLLLGDIAGTAGGGGVVGLPGAASPEAV